MVNHESARTSGFDDETLAGLSYLPRLIFHPIADCPISAVAEGSLKICFLLTLHGLKCAARNRLFSQFCSILVVNKSLTDDVAWEKRDLNFDNFRFVLVADHRVFIQAEWAQLGSGTEAPSVSSRMLEAICQKPIVQGRAKMPLYCVPREGLYSR
jgi:hypothetical protein